MSSLVQYYEVAGFVFSIRTIRRAVPVRSFIPFETEERTGVDFSIEQVEELSPFAEGELLGTYDWFESVCSFYRMGERFIWNRVDSLSGEVEQISWEGEAPKAFRMCGGIREHVLEHLVLIAFHFATLAQGALVLHGSVVEQEGKGYVFLGESGTGKSTHARLWVRHIPHSEVLNDDAPVVRILNGLVMVFGSPWSGKGRVFQNRGVPVCRICRLSQAPYNRLTPLNAQRAFGAMLHACLPSVWVVVGCADVACDTLSGIINQIPLFHLECLPDAEAANVSWGVSSHVPEDSDR